MGHMREKREFDGFTKAELHAAIEDAALHVERDFLRGLLDRTGGNVSRAAKASGIHRSHLQKMLARQRAATPRVPTAWELLLAG